MNRIAGICNLDDMPVHPGEIRRMVNALKYQTQDAESIQVEGRIGLGCTRSTRVGNFSGGSNDSLLACFPNEGCSMTFDGRIDNRRELLRILEPQPAGKRSQISDEELVLAAYGKWGLECPGHLIGDFAFAIWDHKKHRLLCARDHFGVKPFYYSLSKDCFVFGSTPLAILASGRVPPVIHEERIADHLVNPLEGVDKTSSFYKDVFRLPPAHMLIVQAEGMRLERYWELRPAAACGLRTESEYIEAFRELFAESIRCRLDGVPAPASMLSGGMDSSAIVGMGRKVLAEEGKRLHALAVVSNSPDTNRETAHISSVLHQGNLQPHLISETELTAWLDELVEAIEVEAEPFDCLMNLNRAVYLHARDQGISALLDGIDGDTLLSGSGHLTQLWRQGAYRTILEETLKAEGLTAEYKTHRRLFFNSFLSTITPLAPDWIRNIRRQYRYRRVVDTSIRDSIIDREFAVRPRLGERFARLASHSPRPLAFTQMEFHKISLDHPFLTVGLERYERVASAFGIEARHPFTDVRLAEFCLGLPWQLKTQRGWTKMILRRAMEPYLPSAVIWRKDKDSLMWEVNRLILKERADYFYQTTCDEQAHLEPYVDVPKLMRFWQEYLTLGDENHAELIWSGIALAMWLRRHRNMQANLRDTL